MDMLVGGGAGVCVNTPRPPAPPAPPTPFIMASWIADGVGDVELMEHGDICDPNWTSISGDWSMDNGVSSADGLKLPNAVNWSSGDPRRPTDGVE